MSSVYDVPLGVMQLTWKSGAAVDDPEPVFVASVATAILDDDRNYDCTWGACNAEFKHASSDEQLLMLLAKFVEITVNDNIPARKLAKALQVVPQFRVSIARFGFQLIT